VGFKLAWIPAFAGMTDEKPSRYMSLNLCADVYLGPVDLFQRHRGHFRSPSGGTIYTARAPGSSRKRFHLCGRGRRNALAPPYSSPPLRLVASRRRGAMRRAPNRGSWAPPFVPPTSRPSTVYTTGSVTVDPSARAPRRHRRRIGRSHPSQPRESSLPSTQQPRPAPAHRCRSSEPSR